MSFRIVETAGEPIPDYFASLIGKVRVVDKEWIDRPNWHRLIALAPTRGYTFVAEAATIRIFKTADLLAATQATKETETAVAAPSCPVIATDACVTFLSLCPKEKTLLVCTTEAWVELYDIIPSQSPPLALKKRVLLDAAVVYVAWSRPKAFVALTESQLAHYVTTEGVVQEWMEKEPVITLDVCETVSAWVKASSPSTLIVHGVTEIDMNRVDQFAEDEGELVVSSVKILNSEMLVLTVVSMTEAERQSMRLGVITWDPLARDVTVFPAPLDFILHDAVRDEDPFLCHNLSAVKIAKWGTWLIGCNEETVEPLRLLITEEDNIEMVVPEEAFTWPIGESGDDCRMLGMGLDTSVPLRMASENGQTQQRTCHIVVAASDDGILVLSSLGKEAEDVEEPEVSQHEDSSSGESTEILVPEESEQSTVESVVYESQPEVCVMPVAQQMPVVEASTSRFRETVVREEYCFEEVGTEAMTVGEAEKTATILTIDAYNEDAIKHRDQFNILRRLAYKTSIMKGRALELFMHAREAVHRFQQDAVNPEIQQKIDTISRLRQRVQAVHQLTQNFQFSMRKAECTQLVQLQFNMGTSKRSLKNEKRRLESLQEDDPTTEPLSWQGLKKQVDRKLLDFHPEPQGDCVDKMRDLFTLIDPQVTVTSVKDESESERPSDSAWRRVAGSDQFEPPVNSEWMLGPPPVDGRPYFLKTSMTEEICVWRLAGAEERQVSRPGDETSETYASESEALEICSEDEIRQIIQAQEQEFTEKPPGTSADTGVTEEQQAVHPHFQLSPDSELEECMRVLKLVDAMAGLGQGAEKSEMVWLPEAPPVPTMEEYFKNLGREQPLQQRTENVSNAPIAPSAPVSQPEAAQKPSPQPTPRPMSQAPVATQAPLVFSPVSAPQQPQSGYFQAAGFSGFGMPSQMGSFGVAPQLGSLQPGRPGASSGSAIGSGFGAYAQGSSVFASLATAQGGQSQNAFGALAAGQGGQAQSAFGAIGQQGTSQGFGGSVPSSNFGVSTAQASSKLFEMRK